MGTALHALWFRRLGLTLLLAEGAELAVGTGAALVAGYLLPMPALISGVRALLPPLALSLAAMAIGLANERGDSGQLPVA